MKEVFQFELNRRSRRGVLRPQYYVYKMTTKTKQTNLYIQEVSLNAQREWVTVKSRLLTRS